MSKIKVEIDYISLAQWVKYGEYRLNKLSGDDISKSEVSRSFKRIKEILDDGLNKSIKREECEAT